jgi:hypothetical protein
MDYQLDDIEPIFKGNIYFNTFNLENIQMEPMVIANKDEPFYIKGDVMIESNVNVKIMCNNVNCVLNAGKSFILGAYFTYTSIKIDQSCLNDINVYKCYLQLNDVLDCILDLPIIHKNIENNNGYLITHCGITDFWDVERIKKNCSGVWFKPRYNKMVNTDTKIYYAKLSGHEFGIIDDDIQLTKLFKSFDKNNVIFTATPCMYVSYYPINREEIHDILETKYNIKLYNETLKYERKECKRSIIEINEDIYTYNNKIRNAIDKKYVYVDGG